MDWPRSGQNPLPGPIFFIRGWRGTRPGGSEAGMTSRSDTVRMVSPRSMQGSGLELILNLVYR